MSKPYRHSIDNIKIRSKYKLAHSVSRTGISTLSSKLNEQGVFPVELTHGFNGVIDLKIEVAPGQGSIDIAL